jgi:hypothetical protein
MLELYWKAVTKFNQYCAISRPKLWFKLNDGLQHTFHFGFQLTVIVGSRCLYVRFHYIPNDNYSKNKVHYTCQVLKSSKEGWF